MSSYIKSHQIINSHRQPDHISSNIIKHNNNNQHHPHHHHHHQASQNRCKSHHDAQHNQQRGHLCRLSTIPPLPPIKGSLTATGKRLRPLTVEEYERDYRSTASDVELIERIFYGGLETNQLRAALWPYLFGLVKQRGRFRSAPASATHATKTDRQDLCNGKTKGHFIGSINNNTSSKNLNHSDGLKENLAGANQRYVYVEHEDNLKRWRELEKLYYAYQSQWESILPDQELRFSTFRERKSLIERDVIRSDRSHPFYADNSKNLDTFTKLLMTYMMYDFDIGYLQGMSDLAAPILCMFDGDLVKSFWVFVEVMKLFRRNFEYSQKTIHFQLNCLFRLIKITDPKFAQYLHENECSNCFFAFRCIVCQFKRELMRGQHCEDDYSKVLSLWDTIWSVQRRHVLKIRNKIVHTFTIANGKHSTGSGRRSSRRRDCANSNISGNHRHHHHNHQNGGPTIEARNNQLSNGNGGQRTSSPLSNGHNTNKTSNGYHKHANGHSIRSNSNLNGYHNSCNLSQNNNQRTKRHSLKSNGDSPGAQSLMTNFNGYTNGNGYKWSPNSPLSISPASFSSAELHCNSGHYQQQATVKHEQVVYTKETFYSSFDPNQADVPRFKLSETEKFVLALCLSLIRRERNQILLDQLDASEIHQHFINPNLASDLDDFIESAYHIYHFINTDCDMQLLVKGANETNAADFVDGPIGGIGNSPKDDTADTYDLLRDYLIISPTSYETNRLKYSVS